MRQLSDTRRGSDRKSRFIAQKDACPICGVRFANLIKHLKCNRRCRRTLERRYPIILQGSVMDFLRGG